MRTLYLFNTLVKWKILLFVFRSHAFLLCQCREVSIHVSEIQAKPLEHFWKSTGFCPPDPHQSVGLYFLSDDVKTNLAIIGALPYRGIEQVRIHWLLDLVKQRKAFINRKQYDFRQLDAFLDWLVNHRLGVGFELMGNPGNYFSNFLDPIQVKEWENFVSLMARRILKHYGTEQVSRWRFEVWNEPDHHDFDQLNFTTEAFNNYFDASLRGLKNVMTSLRFGGPAENCSPSFDKSKICWSLLQHTNSLDFVSVHKKGNEDVDSIWKSELNFYDSLVGKFPSYRHARFVNDEADVLKNWSLEKEWRADTRYAAFVVSNIILHIKHLMNSRGILYENLSHDNAFLNVYPAFFTQRTLLARFQMNNTNPPHLQFFKKPVYLAMGLLALLGNQQIHHSIPDGQFQTNALQVLATAEINSPDQVERITIILVYHNNTWLNSLSAINVNLNIITKISRARYMIYWLNNLQTNPFDVWQRLGKPVFPDWDQRSQMRTQEIPFSLPTARPFLTNNLQQIELSIPCVALVNVCAKPTKLPGRVTAIKIYNVTYSEVLILWDDKEVQTKCILTYEIEHKPMNATKFRIITRAQSFYPSFQWSPKSWRAKAEATIGLYRIRAVDYWLNRAPYSWVHYYGPKN